jgi:hypothetical protein
MYETLDSRTSGEFLYLDQASTESFLYDFIWNL